MTMKAPVNPRLMNALPIHDSEFNAIEIQPDPSVYLKLCLVFTLHSDEQLEEVSKLGLTSRSLRLTFERCWQIASNILGTGSIRETIHNWNIVEASELLKRLKSHGFAKGVELQHHRIEFSGGSSLDVLAEEVFIEQCESPS